MSSGGRRPTRSLVEEYVAAWSKAPWWAFAPAFGLAGGMACLMLATHSLPSHWSLPAAKQIQTLTGSIDVHNHSWRYEYHLVKSDGVNVDLACLPANRQNTCLDAVADVRNGPVQVQFYDPFGPAEHSRNIILSVRRDGKNLLPYEVQLATLRAVQLYDERQAPPSHWPSRLIALLWLAVPLSGLAIKTAARKRADHSLT